MSQSQIVITLNPLVVRNQTEPTSKRNKERHAAAHRGHAAGQFWGYNFYTGGGVRYSRQTVGFL